MKIWDVDLEFDFLDADNIEKLEKGYEMVVTCAKRAKQEKLTASEAIRKQCQMIKSFFDMVFGPDTSQKLFGTKNSLTLCLEAFQQVADHKLKQDQEWEQTLDKYSPNRIKSRGK